MRFSIEARDGYLQAVVHERNTGEEMREFLLALQAACKQHGQPKILISLRRSRAMFKPEDYGLDGEMRGYVSALVTPACQIAVLGDTHEVNAANEYIEMAARAQGLNVRAFREEHAALQWLQGAGAQSRRYRFTRIVISGAPEDAGVYALWNGDEVVYYGRSDGDGSTIRSRLLDHYYEAARRPTHYSWEVCNDPAARETELLQEHRSRFGRLPRNNKAA
jgi:hypothetical protein